MASPLFRQGALERLSSPDQLDRLITVTSPVSWLALWTLWGITVVIVAWSIWGRLPTRIAGDGLLISSGGQVTSVQAPGNGLLIELPVTIGELVSTGQTVARLAHTEAEQRYRNAKAVLQERLDNQQQTESQLTHLQTIRQHNIELRRRTLQEQLNATEQRAEFLQNQLVQQEQLVVRKLVTRDAITVVRARDEARRAAHEVLEIRNGLAQLDTDHIDLTTDIENRRRAAQEAVNEAQRQVTHIETVLSHATVVTALASGVVTEIKVSPGARVTEGQSLFTLQSGGQYLELLLYIPPQHGKRVKPDMDVQIAPATAQREEFGTLKGRVESVSDFPASPEGMRAVLQNDELARRFAAAGPPYVARVTLLRDPHTVSGYQWSSVKGATLQLSSGTLASAEVTVSHQAPITLVIPLLREYVDWL